jgi:hypothetical protein
MKLKSGIYCIKCLENGKMYIGKSINITDRRQKHFNLLKRGIHDNRKVQNSYNKYGKKSFVFGVIEFCEVDKLSELESFYMKKYNSFDKKNGFNISSENCGFTVQSEETKQILRDIRSNVSKTVYAFTKEGDFVKKWDSISSCASELNVNPCDVRRTISQKQRFCRNLVLNDTKEFRLRGNMRVYNRKNIRK